MHERLRHQESIIMKFCILISFDDTKLNIYKTTRNSSKHVISICQDSNVFNFPPEHMVLNSGSTVYSVGTYRPARGFLHGIFCPPPASKN